MECKLKENSKFYLGENKDSISIFLKKDNQKICEIPTKELIFIEELSLVGQMEVNRLAFSYKSQEKPWCCSSIESKYINFNTGRVFDNDKIFTRTIPKILREGINYYISDSTNYPTMLSAFSNQTINLGWLQLYFSEIGSFLPTDISFNDIEGVKKEDNLMEIVMHFGTEETLHFTFKMPHTQIDAFRVLPQVYSKMTRKEYQLGSEEKYLDFHLFVQYLNKSDLAKEIAYVNQFIKRK